jgi:hypothetical protein
MSEKKNADLERLLQKIVMAKGQTRLLLIAILKNKYPDAKVPK